MVTEQENDKKPDNPQRNWVDTAMDIIFLTPIAIVAFIGGAYLLIRVIGRFVPFWFSGIAGPLTVLAFDVLWGVIMKQWHPISDQMKVLKKILFVIVYAFSTSVLVCWLIGRLFRHVW
ncbi:MAG: hypothetical protein WBL85_06765 [Sedimentisphaerales bacterium]